MRTPANETGNPPGLVNRQAASGCRLGPPRHLRGQPARTTPPHSVLRIYKDQPLVECAHRNNKQTLRVRPIFLHNDDRIEALISIIGLGPVTFGLIEIAVRDAPGDEPLDGLLPKDAAWPTEGTSRRLPRPRPTVAPTGILLDRLTHTQQRLLQLLDTTPPHGPNKAQHSHRSAENGPSPHGIPSRPKVGAVGSRGESSRGLFVSPEGLRGGVSARRRSVVRGPSSRGSRRDPLGQVHDRLRLSREVCGALSGASRSGHGRNDDGEDPPCRSSAALTRQVRTPVLRTRRRRVGAAPAGSAVQTGV